MDTKRHKHFVALLCITACNTGCSSSDRNEESDASGNAGRAGSGTLEPAAGARSGVPAVVAGSNAGGRLGQGAAPSQGGAVSVAGTGAGGSETGLSGAGTGATAVAKGGTANSGGAGALPSAGTGNQSSEVSTIVWSWGQAGNEGALADPAWVVDGAQHANEGATAAHPPTLAAASPSALTIDCGAQAHTELSFYLEKLSAAATLELLVDGTSRYRFGTTSATSGTWDWKKYTFDVPEGIHSYVFRVQSASDTTTSFALDSIVCRRNPPAAALNATIDFDRGFIPPETAGAWLVDSAVRGYSDGATTTAEAAIHPPALLANTKVEMTFDCGQTPHTQLALLVEKLAADATLDLLVDGTSRYTWGITPNTSGTWDWKEYLFDVPQGTHVYTFRAQSSSDTLNSFALDFLRCKNVAPAIATNATVDFDHGYIPPETTGAWLVDNASGTYSDGATTSDEAAIHPPALLANTTADVTFDCGNATHTELAFFLEKLGADASLELLVDGNSRYTWGLTSATSGTWDWKEYVIDVPQAAHAYTFRAKSSSNTPRSFVLDFLRCKNNAPAAASNATVDFDLGFIPPETTGAWLVDNMSGTYSDGSRTNDEAAIHPPVLLGGTAVDMKFDCNQLAHSKLTFYLQKLSTAPTLDLLLDGTPLQTLTGTGTWDWKKQTFDVPSGVHTYTFRAQSVSEALTSYAVDFLQCTP